MITAIDAREGTRSMTDLQVRKIPFDFDGDVPFIWNPQNPEFSITCNAVSVLAIAFERFILAVMKDALPLVTDPEMREEADAFTRQEGQHSRMHRLHVRALVRRYPGVAADVGPGDRGLRPAARG